MGLPMTIVGGAGGVDKSGDLSQHELVEVVPAPEVEHLGWGAGWAEKSEAEAAAGDGEVVAVLVNEVEIGEEDDAACEAGAADVGSGDEVADIEALAGVVVDKAA